MEWKDVKIPSSDLRTPLCVCVWCVSVVFVSHDMRVAIELDQVPVHLAAAMLPFRNYCTASNTHENVNSMWLTCSRVSQIRRDVSNKLLWRCSTGVFLVLSVESNQISKSCVRGNEKQALAFVRQSARCTRVHNGVSLHEGGNVGSQSSIPNK